MMDARTLKAPSVMFLLVVIMPVQACKQASAHSGGGGSSGVVATACMLAQHRLSQGSCCAQHTCVLPNKQVFSELEAAQHTIGCKRNGSQAKHKHKSLWCCVQVWLQQGVSGSREAIACAALVASVQPVSRCPKHPC